MEKESATPGISLSNLSHSHFFIFRYTKGLIPNPPTSVTVEHCHGSGSSTWIGWVGAIAVGGGERRRGGQGTEMKGRAALWSRNKKQGATGAKC
jgi:hypothetical protein